MDKKKEKNSKKETLDSDEKKPLTQHQTRKRIEDILEQKEFEKQYVL
ncbi:hypothetical protein [Vibrio vulnificus]|nr:hypothetical protein [Vibrio vulnificus]MCA0767444.1 hypothetical protein [Vibrio vulnificus]MDT9656291.1 hypothetical protein [Vibrio vulnificus]HDY7615411.1 hypothetical protein [Vibrio vulnificus]HDY8083589.1 hypothetical protein [Vibrio vulnificus]HDY8165423.1 hypothetical protein [Vibrio vulnificus]